MAMPTKLHINMDFKKSKSFSKILMSWLAPRGPKFLKIEIFHENGMFSVIIIL